MLSPSDTILIFVVALLLFGPEQVPKIARQLGDAMRHVQNTTSSFMAEMDRAAAAAEIKPQPIWEPPDTTSWEQRSDDGTSDEQGSEEAGDIARSETADVAPPDVASIDQSKPPA